MGFINTYVPEEYAMVFDVEDGSHPMCVKEIRVTQTKDKTKNMLEIDFIVKNNAGQKVPVVYTERFVEGDYFNKSITRFFDAFKIPRGDFNFINWKGKIGKGTFAHKADTYLDAYGVQKTSNKCVLKFFEVENAPASNQAPQVGTQAAATQPVAQPAPIPQNTPAAAPETFPEDIPYDGDVF